MIESLDSNESARERVGAGGFAGAGEAGLEGVDSSASVLLTSIQGYIIHKVNVERCRIRSVTACFALAVKMHDSSADQGADPP